MTKPTTYLLRMIVFLLAVGGVIGLQYEVLWTIFWNSPELNGLILFVLAVGIVWNLYQVVRLSPEVVWLDHYRLSPDRLAGAPTARLLAPMARMLRPREDGRRLMLSAVAMRSMLDSLASRLDESRELSRYMTGLLIFLGLLGTFWGLLKTIGSVAEVIGAMTVGAGDVTVLFDQLKAGLEKPLAGMGTAFSASLFGLAGALVLGFLDLTAGQAQNRFFNELEEWLAGLTHLSSGALADGDGSVPVYVQALLEQTAENMESLRRVLMRGDEANAQSRQVLQALNERIGDLAEAMRSNQQLLLRVADVSSGGDDVARLHLRNIDQSLQRIAEDARAGRTEGMADLHLRNIDQSLQRIAEDARAGRTEAMADLRNDLRLLTRTVAALSVDKR
jgi:hypothetical protein